MAQNSKCVPENKPQMLTACHVLCTHFMLIEAKYIVITILKVGES
jgi:hypothetical protein